MPMATSAISGSMNTGNMVLYQGSPTDSAGWRSASAISGASVPTSTMAAAQTSRMLL